MKWWEWVILGVVIVVAAGSAAMRYLLLLAKAIFNPGAGQ